LVKFTDCRSSFQIFPFIKVGIGTTRKPLLLVIAPVSAGHERPTSPLGGYFLHFMVKLCFFFSQTARSNFFSHLLAPFPPESPCRPPVVVHFLFSHITLSRSLVPPTPDNFHSHTLSGRVSHTFRRGLPADLDVADIARLQTLRSSTLLRADFYPAARDRTATKPSLSPPVRSTDRYSTTGSKSSGSLACVPH